MHDVLVQSGVNSISWLRSSSIGVFVGVFALRNRHVNSFVFRKFKQSVNRCYISCPCQPLRYVVFLILIFVLLCIVLVVEIML
eukprot:m.180010 g.180010  ORF g.180010 m.180010 type:complete len:83 (+) comp14651_c3_seq1:2595-2843(+)